MICSVTNYNVTRQHDTCAPINVKLLGGGRAQAGYLGSDQFFRSNARPQGSHPGSKEYKFPNPIFLPKMHCKRAAEIGTEKSFFFFKGNKAMTSKCNIPP